MFKTVIKVVVLTMFVMIASFVYQYSVYNAKTGGIDYQEELFEALKNEEYVVFKEKIYNLIFNISFDGGVYKEEPLLESNGIVNDNNSSYRYEVDVLEARRKNEKHNLVAFYLYDLKLDNKFNDEVFTIKMHLEVGDKTYLIKLLEDVKNNLDNEEENNNGDESYFLEFFEIAKKYEKGAKEPIDDTLYYLVYNINEEDKKRDEEPTYIEDLTDAKLIITYDVEDKEISESFEIIFENNMLPNDIIIKETDIIVDDIYIDLYQLNKGSVVKTVVIMVVIGVVIFYLMFINTLVIDAIRKKKNPELKERELLIQKKLLEEKRSKTDSSIIDDKNNTDNQIK